MIYTIFWGSATRHGSLCNIREYLNRKQVSKNVPVFSVGDEFVTQIFKGHLVASICRYFEIHSPQNSIKHEVKLEWLETTAKCIVSEFLLQSPSTDSVHVFHKSFMSMAFLYCDLRAAIRWEDGVHIIRHWKTWIPHFLGVGMTNYASEAIANINASFPAHVAYIATHNRTVNMQGKAGKGKPIDQLIEHYNL